MTSTHYDEDSDKESTIYHTDSFGFKVARDDDISSSAFAEPFYNPSEAFSADLEPISTDIDAVLASQNSLDSPRPSLLLIKNKVTLSHQVRSSIAASAAIIRGPPATRHFGGNRGGLLTTPPDGYDDGERRKGVSSIVICGAERSVVYTHDKTPPGRSYPIVASGAIMSDAMDDGKAEYLCCFLAEEKRMVLFELKSRMVLVELHMSSKLNYWRYLPPEADGNTLVYMLITPVGGYHWMPNDESPNPRQVWRRGSKLRDKKILSYEEGGNTGQKDEDRRSNVALILALSLGENNLEAWCAPVYGHRRLLCISEDVLGAALCQPSKPRSSELPEFYPLIVIAKKVESEIAIEIRMLDADPETGALSNGEVLVDTIIDYYSAETKTLTEPILAMGNLPSVLFCCLGVNIIVVVRNKGLLIVYEFIENTLTLIGKKDVGQYVVDAAVRWSDSDQDIEVVLMLCEPDTPEDGRIATLTVTRV